MILFMKDQIELLLYIPKLPSDAKTPLTCAVRSQSLPCVELLIKDGAKVTTNHKEILYDPDHALSLSPLAASVKLKHRYCENFRQFYNLWLMVEARNYFIQHNRGLRMKD